jgi:hypothetical protein
MRQRKQRLTEAKTEDEFSLTVYATKEIEVYLTMSASSQYEGDQTMDELARMKKRLDKAVKNIRREFEKHPKVVKLGEEKMVMFRPDSRGFIVAWTVITGEWDEPEADVRDAEPLKDIVYKNGFNEGRLPARVGW